MEKEKNRKKKEFDEKNVDPYDKKRGGRSAVSIGNGTLAGLVHVVVQDGDTALRKSWRLNFHFYFPVQLTG